MKRKHARPTRPAQRAPRSPAVPMTASPEPFSQRLFAPVDIASIALFRVAFGLLMLWDMLQYLLGGWLESYLVPPFLFKFPGFGWVERAAPATMKLMFVAMAIAAVLIALGLAYRAACAAFFVGHTYMLLLDTAHYQNHLYLISLLAFLLILDPSARGACPGCAQERAAGLGDDPCVVLVAVALQIGIPYF